METKNLQFMLSLKHALTAERQRLQENPDLDKLEAHFDTLWRRDLQPYNSDITQFKQDIQLIKERLHLYAPPSVDYSFIRHDATRHQLQIDNLHMENNIFQVDKPNPKYLEFFYDLCLWAFMQIEELINYYYHQTYNNIADLLQVLQQYNRSYTPLDTHTNLLRIPISVKIWAWGNQFFSYQSQKDYTTINMHNLRYLRNSSLHRCTVIQNGATDLNEEEKRIQQFLARNGPNEVRDLLRRVANKIRQLGG